MRPTASFTLHAILAACLAALAASSAAGGGPIIDDEPTLYLSGQVFGGRATGKGEQLEVQSFQWGALPTAWHPNSHGGWIADVERPAARGAGHNELGMDDTAGKEKTQSGSGRASGNMVMKGSTIGENSTVSGRVTGIAADPADPSGARQTGHSMLGASEKITVGGGQTESGLPTGKRQHKPMLLNSPLAQGSLRVRVKMPWLSCEVGRKYPSLTLAGSGKRYVLEDVVVTGCGTTASGPTEEIAFSYGKISW